MFRACGLLVLVVYLLITTNALAQMDKCIAALKAIDRGDEIEGVDINATDVEGKTVLMYAIERGNKKIIEWLLIRKANVNAKDIHGKTALMYAVYITQYVYAEEAVLQSLLSDTIFIIQSLLAAGADINATDIDGRTALMHARHPMYGTARIIQLLLAEGAKVNTDATLGLLSRDRDFYMFLLESEYDVTYKNDIKHLVKKETHLHWAFENFKLLLTTSSEGVIDITHEDIAKSLIAIGSSSNKSSVSIHSRQFALKSLLTAGVDIDARDEASRTVLMHASFNGYLEEIVQQLIDVGANVNATDAQGRTALMYASSIGNEKVVQKLLAAEVDVSITDAQGRTALVYANSPHLHIEFGIKTRYEVYINDKSLENTVRLLSSSKVDFNSQDIKARRDLENAFSSSQGRYPNSSKFVKMLLEMQRLNPRMHKDDN